MFPTTVPQVAIQSLQLREPDGSEVLIGYHDLGLAFVFVAAVLCVYLGLLVASRDKFFGQTREERLKGLVFEVKKLVKTNITVREMMRLVENKALFGDLRQIFLGGKRLEAQHLCRPFSYPWLTYVVCLCVCLISLHALTQPA